MYSLLGSRQIVDDRRHRSLATYTNQTSFWLGLCTTRAQIDRDWEKNAFFFLGTNFNQFETFTECNRRRPDARCSTKKYVVNAICLFVCIQPDSILIPSIEQHNFCSEFEIIQFHMTRLEIFIYCDHHSHEIFGHRNSFMHCHRRNPFAGSFNRMIKTLMSWQQRRPQ